MSSENSSFAGLDEEAAAERATWELEVEALLERRAVAGHDDSREPAGAWTRAAAPDAVVVVSMEDVPSEAEQIAVPAALVDVPDPAAFLNLIADALGDGGALVASVPWCVPVPGARRSLHPASLVGLLLERFAVDELVRRDVVLGVRARVEADAERRESHAVAALLGIQDAISERLDAGTRWRLRALAFEAADELSTRAVATASDHAAAARQQRDQARASLKAERERHSSEVWRLEDAVARLTDHRDAALVELSAAERRRDAVEGRLRRVTGTRWWQLHGVIVDVRARRIPVTRIPGRLAKIARRRP